MMLSVCAFRIKPYFFFGSGQGNQKTFASPAFSIVGGGQGLRWGFFRLALYSLE